MDKARERWLVERFRAVYDKFPVGELIDHERPDFVVITDSGRRLGIELTDYVNPYFSPSLHPAQQSAIRSVSDRATAIREDQIAGTLIASVDFAHDVRINKRDISAIAESVAAVIATTPEDAERYVVENDGQLPEAVDAVHLARLTGEHGLQFINVQAFWLGPVDEDKLRQIIANKESKLIDYRQTCDEVWLLIIIDCNNPASATERPLLFNTPFRTTFNRVLLLHDNITAIELPSGSA